MAEEVWSGSSLGSSFLNDGGDDDEMSHPESDQVHDTIIDREVKLVTEKYLSRREGESVSVQSARQVISSDGDQGLSFDLSSSASHHKNSQIQHQAGDRIEGDTLYSDHQDYVSELSNPNQSADSDSSPDMMELLLPSFIRFDKLLNVNGCLTVSVTTVDVDIENRSISVFVLDSWAESIINFVAEILEDRQKNQQDKVDASFEVQRSDISVSNMDVEVYHLQEKLHTAKEKEKDLRMKATQSGK